MIPNTSERNHSIDTLRGLAVLLVVFNHIGLRIPLRKTDLIELFPRQFLSALNFSGQEAVLIFFVISGFLIATNSIERWGSLAQIDWRAFYARRFARIAPGLLAVITLLSIGHLLGLKDYVINKSGQSLWGAVSSALFMHLNWYEAQHGYLPGGWDVMWSLSIEELFYLGFPVACLLMRRKAVLVPLLIVLALSGPFARGLLHANELWQDKAYWPGMAAIAWGVLGAMLSAHGSPPKSTSRWLLTLGIIGLVATVFWGFPLYKLMGHHREWVLTASTTAFLVGAHARQNAKFATSPRRLKFDWAWTWLRSWGQLSYEIYLTHMFVVYAAVQLHVAMGKPMPLGYLAYLPICVTCWLVGKGFAHWVTEPARRKLAHNLPWHRRQPVLVL